MYKSVTWDQTLDPKGSHKAQMNNFVQYNYLDFSQHDLGCYMCMYMYLILQKN